jgi:hypothetical protein
VTGHPAAREHGKFPQGKVGTFLRGNQHLKGGVFSSGDIFSFDFG